MERLFRRNRRLQCRNCAYRKQMNRAAQHGTVEECKKSFMHSSGFSAARGYMLIWNGYLIINMLKKINEVKGNAVQVEAE